MCRLISTESTPSSSTPWVPCCRAVPHPCAPSRGGQPLGKHASSALPQRPVCPEGLLTYPARTGQSLAKVLAALFVGYLWDPLALERTNQGCFRSEYNKPQSYSSKRSPWKSPRSFLTAFLSSLASLSPITVQLALCPLLQT